ncbi:hypothetical protein B0D78_02000 [Pyramidobacter sp. C12-8]|nr:hypothetical protein B0D78_02000 [Pyramidobacter sp. C12-8]
MRKPPFLWDELDVASVTATLREAIEAEFFAPDAESGFRPFDRVLVRHDDGDIWTADWFSHVERGDDAWHLLEEHDSLMRLRDVAKLIEQPEEVWAIVDNRTGGIARCEALHDEAAQKKNRPAATGRFQERSKDMNRPLPRL